MAHVVAFVMERLDSRGSSTLGRSLVSKGVWSKMRGLKAESDIHNEHFTNISHIQVPNKTHGASPLKSAECSYVQNTGTVDMQKHPWLMILWRSPCRIEDQSLRLRKADGGA